MSQNYPYQKVFYRPVEAAIRWSRLTKFESEILAKLGNRLAFEPNEFPRWPALHLNTERIIDAIRHGDLPFGQAGVTCTDPLLLDSPDITIRHVDLKNWMALVYPDQKPDFLFDPVEQRLHPAVSIDVARSLLVEREVLQSQLDRCHHHCLELHAQNDALLKKLETSNQSGSLGNRAEKTYLHIVGSLLGLLLGHSPSGKAYSCFKSQEAVISALIAHSGGEMGITERTLQAKFATAKRLLTM